MYSYINVHIGKHFSDNFTIYNHLKQGDAFWTLFFNFPLEYAMRKVQENQVGLKLSWTHQLLVYDDDVNLLRNNIDTIKKTTETLIDASKEIGLEVNADDTVTCWVGNTSNNLRILDLTLALLQLIITMAISL
jgi:hypothetical protein